MVQVIISIHQEFPLVGIYLPSHEVKIETQGQFNMKVPCKNQNTWG